MSEITFFDSNFEVEVLKSDQPVLVDFFATWCGPCKMQEPIIAELAKEVGDKFKVGVLDIDQNPDMTQKYNVMSVPTIIIFKGGQPIHIMTGVQTKSELLEKLNRV
ncbi:MAG TPA: thioredoxin [Patescibacteria group bacterium]|nr:thioredoxin [Patescibacteria group bacterium]